MKMRFQWLKRVDSLLEWGLFLSALTAAAFIIIPATNPPIAKLIVTAVAYVVTINFSIPLSFGYVGLTPIVANSTLLDGDMGLRFAIAAAAIGIAFAEVVRPAWQPLNQPGVKQPIRRVHRLGLGVFHLLNLAIAGLANYSFGGRPTLIQLIVRNVPNTAESTFSPIILTAIYFTIFLLLRVLYWRLNRSRGTLFFDEASPHLLGITFFAVPLMLFIASADIGIPAFLLLMVSISTFAIINGRSWLGRYSAEQRIQQFSRLNDEGSSLRETLDLPTVITQIHSQVNAAIPGDHFYLTLLDDNEKWEQTVTTRATNSQPLLTTHADIQPDGLTLWVIENRRILELTPDNFHFAYEHDMVMPSSEPRVWMGVPLTSADKTIGAMVVERAESGEPFSAWNREMFHAIAGQASAAIDNARLYGRTDTALSRRLEQLQALLFSINEGVLMVDRQGVIVLINPTAADLLGSNLQQLRGTDLNIPQASRALGFTVAQLQNLLTTLSEGESPPSTTETYIVRQPDITRYIERNAVTVASDEGALMGWLMVFRDVTQERQRAEWRADLTRMIVHDLRNPITTISSSVNLIGSEIDGREQKLVSDLLTTADYSCGSLLEMVDSLLDINRAEAGTFVIDAEAMRLPSLVQDVMARLRPLAQQRGIRLTTHSPADLPAVWADEQVVRRVLVNLLDNALKFTPRGGEVRVTLAADTAINPEHDTGTRVTITDDGPGIPADQRERIFDRFVTFNQGGGQVRGTGLGLTFCKLAVEAHDSRIWTEESADGGSSFIFTLPGIPHF